MENLYCFRPQRYKTFESYSQRSSQGEESTDTVSDRKDTKLLKAIHNGSMVFAVKTKTVSDRKDTKLLKAIHNAARFPHLVMQLFQTAKIQNF